MLRSLATDRRARRFVFFVVLVVVTAVIALVRAEGDLPLTPDGVRVAIQSWGVLAPLAFTGAFVLRPFILFPSTLLFVAGGLAFGVTWGTIYAAIGGTIGAVIGFSIARALGREFVVAELGHRWPQFTETRWGFGLVFLLSLIPVVPMTAINYGAGLSGMGLLPFVAEVVAGVTPRAFAYSVFGNSLLDIGSREFVVALGLLAALLIVPLLFRRRLWPMRAERGAASSSASVPGRHI